MGYTASMCYSPSLSSPATCGTLCEESQTLPQRERRRTLATVDPAEKEREGCDVASPETDSTVYM